MVSCMSLRMTLCNAVAPPGLEQVLFKKGGGSAQ